METISSTVNSASKYIFGDNAEKPAQSGTEPVSGESGKGTTEEPYDGGNKDEVRQNNTVSGDSTGQKLEGEGKQGIANAGPDPDVTQKPTPADDFNPASSRQPVQKTEGANQPLEEPSGEQRDAIADKKDDGEAVLAKHDPNDHSGEPLKVHDGGEKEETSDTPGESRGGDFQESKDDKGTGEQWVKTSGLEADGGDFDATKPGAAREADRLLEQKGVHKDTPGKASSPAPVTATGDSHSPAPKEKQSVTQKLKDKLHIGHKKE